MRTNVALQDARRKRPLGVIQRGAVTGAGPHPTPPLFAKLWRGRGEVKD